jgi:DNA helicase II / ATP-dependent DNA helicase PcrA
MTQVRLHPRGGFAISPAVSPPTDPTLPPAERAILDDEIGMAARVAKRIAASLAQASEDRPADKRKAEDAELLALRDQIGDARGEDVAALLAQMMRSAGVRAVEGPRATGAVDARAPYFGHLRLQEGGRSRDVLIGKKGMIDRAAGVVIVDWRDAPVSRLYYRYEEGDDYEEELGEKLREGKVLVRRTVTFRDGKLVRVRSPSATFVRDEADRWVALARVVVPELHGGVGKAERAPPPVAGVKRRLGALGDVHLRPDKHLPEIAALIDKHQYAAMTETDAGVVVLQGGAGSGKTTVALHRIAWLTFADPERFRPSHIVVLVAQPQLARYVERLLPSLDVGDVRVTVYDAWVRGAVTRLFGKIKEHVIAAENVPSEVARAKKHPGLLDAIRVQIERQLQALDVDFARAIAGRACADRVPGRGAGAPLFALESWLTAIDGTQGIPDDTRERARRAVLPVLDELKDIRRAHAELISDASLWALCTDARFGEERLDERTLTEALRYTKRQVEEQPDDSDIDEDARVPIDDLGEDPSDPRGALDVHDLPLMLNLYAARTGDLGPIAYDHAAVDEAQDLAAVELAPVLVACGARQSVTLAGDTVQRVVFDNGYARWEELTEQLQGVLRKGVRAVEPFRLSYRSTAEVVAFSRRVLGPLAPATPPQAVRSGAPIECFAFHDTGEEIAFLAENLRSLMAREPNASVALLFRYPERARFFGKMLSDAEVPRLRLVLPADAHGEGDDFSFAPGVDITTISRVKGLEYDYVVLAEVTENMYPGDDASRHLLHIGATRAAHQLWITTSKDGASSLLPADVIADG